MRRPVVRGSTGATCSERGSRATCIDWGLERPVVRGSRGTCCEEGERADAGPYAPLIVLV